MLGDNFIGKGDRMLITRQDRMRLNGHPSFVLWLTGFSGAGKSTVSRELERRFFDRRIRSYVLDGDSLRSGLNRDLGFSRQDRGENVRRVAEVARLFVEAGVVAIVALISPYREDRERARSLFAPGEFVEVYVKCPLEVCERRDPKGLYAKARGRAIGEFTGISSPYEEPLSPDVVVETNRMTPEEAADRIVAYLVEKGLVPR